MKKLSFFLLAFALVLGVASCEKEETKNDDTNGSNNNNNNNPDKSTLILGVWEIYELSYTSYENDTVVDQGTEPIDSLSLNFKANGMVDVIEVGDSVETSMYTISGDMLIFDGDTMTISVLTTSNLEFKGIYHNHFGGVHYREEETIKARR